jgi:NAD(P)-dependent dehydrogenase (short-subunit alcohol dehydrogenase family)
VVTSLAARVSPGFPGQPGAPAVPAYAATKGALEALVKHWASLFGPHGFRVNAVAPGIIETEMSNFTKTELGRNLALNTSGPSTSFPHGRSSVSNTRDAAWASQAARSFSIIGPNR